MQSFVRTVALGSTLAILAAAGTLAAQATDPFIGTWKLNVAKSKYDPGPPPKSVTITFATAGKGIKLIVTGVEADGNPISTQYTANLDGKDYPVSGSPDYDTVSLKQINASTRETTRKKGGKVVQTVRAVVSKDGKQYTSRTTGTNAKGQHLKNVVVFEKQ